MAEPAAQVVPFPAVPSAEPVWHPLRRLGFRLSFVFFGLQLLPFPFGYLPKTDAIGDAFNSLESVLAAWVGRNLLGLTFPSDLEQNGSGDRTVDYLLLLVIAVLSVAIAAVWSVLDRRRVSYATLDRALRVVLRFALASILFSYGFSKLFPTQMPNSLTRLIEPYGRSSPMGLLWAFLGQVPAYEMFAGAAEVTAGILLLFRRTTGLGGIVAMGVMGNVVIMNFTYDVPVKIFASLLWLIALYLAIPDLLRVAKLLVLRRPVAPAPYPPRSRRRRLVCGLAAAALGGTFFVQKLVDGWSGYREYGGGAKPPSIAGIYDVRELALNGRPAPLLATEPHRYARLAVDDLFVATVEANGTYARYRHRIDAEHRSLGLTRRGGGWPGALTFTAEPDGGLILEGVLDGDLVRMRLARADMSKELLAGRGFHWVNEAPFNR